MTVNIESVVEYLNSIALGIRFRPNFSLGDKFGTITDEILYSKNSYFGPKFFPTAHHALGGTDRALKNEDTGDSLTLNPSNVIFEFNLPEAGEADQLESVLAAFNEQIVLGIMKRYGVTQIERVGLVHRYLFTIPELADNFLKVSIGKTLEGIKDINLRFSKRYPQDQALIKEGVNDYVNVIFNIIKKADKEELFISIDYQWYFLPALEKVSQVEFGRFLEKSNTYNRLSFTKWLNDSYGKIDG